MKWYIKEFSLLTNVSVRTLHHYDDIGLLKPSVRLPNGYRMYSHDDLLRLEQILALKFFGFDLKKIVQLLKKDGDQLAYLNAQQKCLDEQIGHLMQANQTLKTIIKQMHSGKQVDWSNIVSLIKGFSMTKDIYQSWENYVCFPDQRKRWGELRSRFTEEQIKDIDQRWDVLIAKVQKHLKADPTSAIGQKLAQEWMNLTDETFGEFQELRDATWLAYKHEKIPNAFLDKKTWNFIDKAIKQMYKNKNNKKT